MGYGQPIISEVTIKKVEPGVISTGSQVSVELRLSGLFRLNDHSVVKISEAAMLITCRP
jgi:hypothetical protein